MSILRINTEGVVKLYVKRVPVLALRLNNVPGRGGSETFLKYT